MKGSTNLLIEGKSEMRLYLMGSERLVPGLGIDEMMKVFHSLWK